MTREEFIKKYKNDCYYYFDGYYSDCIDDFLINIYNDIEAQLEAKDEEIGLWKAEFRRMQDIAINKDVALEKALEEIKELKDEQ